MKCPRICQTDRNCMLKRRETRTLKVRIRIVLIVTNRARDESSFILSYYLSPAF